MKQFTMGVIFGNRDFFPDQLITEARPTSKPSSREVGHPRHLAGRAGF